MDKIFFQNHIFFKFLDTFSALFFNISIPSFKPIFTLEKHLFSRFSPLFFVFSISAVASP